MRDDVGTVASRVVVTATPDMSVEAAAQLMRNHHVGTLVVVEAPATTAKPVGLVTDRDLVLEVLAQAVDPKLVTVADVMSPKRLVAREDETVFTAIETMHRHGVRRLIVVDEAQRLVGLLSMDDAIAVLAEQLSAIAKTMDAEMREEHTRRRPVESVA